MHTDIGDPRSASEISSQRRGVQIISFVSLSHTVHATSQTLTPQVTTPNRSKSERRGVPPVPPPYTSVSASTVTYSTLNRDRTDTTQALIPGFSDVPGSRGQSSSNTDYSQLKYSDSATTCKGGGGGGPVKLPLPTGEGEYSSIDGGPGGNHQGQSRNLKKFHSQPTSGGDYSALVSPVNSAHSKRALPPHPISKAGSLDADENIGGIYSDIDAYSQIEYSEVDAPKQKPAPPSPAPPVSSHSNAPSLLRPLLDIVVTIIQRFRGLH